MNIYVHITGEEKQKSEEYIYYETWNRTDSECWKDASKVLKYWEKSTFLIFAKIKKSDKK